MHLEFVRDKDGKPAMENLLGDASPVRPKKLAQNLQVVAKKEWRDHDRPTIQL